MQSSAAIDLLATCAWFRDIPDSARLAVSGLARLRWFAAQEPVFRQGDTCDGLYAVIQGQVKLTSYSAEGARFLMLIARPGDWFGEVSVLDGNPRQQDAVSERRSLVCLFPDADLKRAAKEHPELWRALGHLCAAHQRAALLYILNLVSLSPTGRVAATLLSLHDKTASHKIRATQEEISAAVGLSRQTVSAILGRMQTSGLIQLGYGSIMILNDLSASIR